jgi:S1-C subfamily serine protease
MSQPCRDVQTRAPNPFMVSSVGRTGVAAPTLVAMLVAIVMAVSGCDKIMSRLGSGGHVNQPPSPVAVDAPNADLVNNPVVAATAPSVIKIHGVSNLCQKVLDGTGFVVAPHRVMSNAHVIAGADTISADVAGTTYDANVVSYDPNADIAVLDVPNLPSEPLTFAEGSASSGADALMLGYPGGGGFVATPTRIREVIKLAGPDIYQTTRVTREVYTVRGAVRQGDSGGPLIDINGRVLGVVFGLAEDDPETGYVLTAAEVAPQMAHLGDAQPVATGACVS